VYNISSSATFLRLLYTYKMPSVPEGIQVCCQLYALKYQFSHCWNTTISGVEHSKLSIPEKAKHFL